jgi:hypothetical protein
MSLANEYLFGNCNITQKIKGFNRRIKVIAFLGINEPLRGRRNIVIFIIAMDICFTCPGE